MANITIGNLDTPTNNLSAPSSSSPNGNNNNIAVNRETYFQLINERVALFFSGLELFRFRQASDIWGLSTDAPQSKKVFLDVASSFSLLAACESMYYSIAFLEDGSVDTMYQEVFNAFQTLLELYEMDKEKYDEARSFCKLLEDLCCILQVRTSMIMIYRALKANKLDEIDYDEFAAAARSISKRPLKCTHKSLRRLKINTSSEIELLCRLFEAQIGISSYQFKDATVRLYQCKTLYNVWENSVERGAANLGIISDSINNLNDRNNNNVRNNTFKMTKGMKRNGSSADNLSGRRSRSSSLTSSNNSKSKGFRFWSGLSIIQSDNNNNFKDMNDSNNHSNNLSSSTSNNNNNNNNVVVNKNKSPRNSTRVNSINSSNNMSTRTSPRNRKKENAFNNKKFNLPPIFPWLKQYLDTCLAKSTLFFHGILTKSHLVEEYNKYSFAKERQLKNKESQQRLQEQSKQQQQIGFIGRGNNNNNMKVNTTNEHSEKNTNAINSKEWNDVQDVLWNKNGKNSPNKNNKTSVPSSLDKKDSNNVPSVFDGMKKKDEVNSSRSNDSHVTDNDNNNKKMLRVANENNRRLLPMQIGINLTKDTALDFIGIASKMINRCQATISSSVYVTLVLNVSALKDGYPFSLKTGYICPDFEYNNNTNKSSKKGRGKQKDKRRRKENMLSPPKQLNDGTNNYQRSFTNLDLVVEGDEDDAFENARNNNNRQYNAKRRNRTKNDKYDDSNDDDDNKNEDDDDEDDDDEGTYNAYKKRAKERQNRYKNYMKPQGLKSWPIIFSLPTSFAISTLKDRHWPNIVSLLIGGIPQLNGYKDPFFHHESRVGTSPTSYYICNIDENVSMVIIAESSRSSSNGPARPIIDFCRQVAPVLRMQHVFDSLKPLKFGLGNGK